MANKIEQRRCNSNDLCTIVHQNVSDHRCIAPPVIKNAVIKFDPINRLLYVTCIKGYQFPDGTIKRMQMCNLDGSWNIIDDCTSRNLQIVYLIYSFLSIPYT